MAAAAIRPSPTPRQPFNRDILSQPACHRNNWPRYHAIHVSMAQPTLYTRAQVLRYHNEGRQKVRSQAEEADRLVVPIDNQDDDCRNWAEPPRMCLRESGIVESKNANRYRTVSEAPVRWHNF